MTDLRSPLPAGNGFRESCGPRLCRCRRQKPERPAGRFACSPTLDYVVSFQRPHQSLLWLVLWGLVVELVWTRRVGGTSASSAFCGNAAESTVSRRPQTARHVPDASAACTNRQ